MQPAKVLEVLEASIGGARKHVLQILRGLDRGRFELHLACSLERDPGAAAEVEALRSEGIRVSVVPMLRRPAPLSDALALRALSRLMRAERFQLVHTHAAKAGFLGRLAARRARVPAILHTPHTFPFELTDTVLAPLYRLLERRAAAWADRIVLVAPSQREAAERARLCPSSRLVVIENGIELPPADPAEARRRYRAELGLGEDTPAFGFVGRIAPQKDIQTFLSVAGEVCREMPSARAFLVGEAGGRRYLRSLRPRISPDAWRAVALGERPSRAIPWSASLPVAVLGGRPDAADLVAAFDVVVLPSLYEGLPYALLEAMACRVPVVASAVTGNRDAIEDGRSGVLVPAGDVAGFARAVLALLADGGRRRTLGAAARERVAARFAEQRFLREMDALYTEMLERASRR